MDVELKFQVGGEVFSIDVRKNFIESLKDIYKALVTIGRMQRRDEMARENSLRCLEAFGSMYKVGNVASDEQIVQHFNALVGVVNSTLLDRFARRDYSPVFDRYIHK